jgi:hypothetical protein
MIAIDTSTFTGTWQQLRQVAADFIRAIPQADEEALNAGLKCFNLHYLGLQTDSEIELHQAALLFAIVGRAFLQAEYALILAKAPHSHSVARIDRGIPKCGCGYIF